MFPMELTTVNIGAVALAVVQINSTQSFALLDAIFPVVVVEVKDPNIIY